MRKGYFFQRPAFWRGAARVLDLGSTVSDFRRYAARPRPWEGDLWADWEAVGRDLWGAIAAVDREGRRSPVEAAHGRAAE